MEDDPLGRRVMLGLVLMAVMLIAGGLGLMIWDDRHIGNAVPGMVSSAP
jgi:hypothetical protein